MGFLGSYQHQIDEKGRLSLPAPFRRESDDIPLVLVQAFPECLSLYPQEAWKGVEVNLRQLLRDQPDSRSYVLGITASAVEVTPDRQGRILVPARLQEAAGLEGPVLVVGNLHRIELWNPARFQDSVSIDAQDRQRFTQYVFA